MTLIMRKELPVGDGTGQRIKGIAMWFVGIGLVLSLLKWQGIGPFAAISWWWVVLPFGLAIVWWSYADSTGYYQRKAMEKMDKKRAERRVKSLQNLGMDHKGRRR